jgi:hypothetical protein
VISANGGVSVARLAPWSHLGLAQQLLLAQAAPAAAGGRAERFPAELLEVAAVAASRTVAALHLLLPATHWHLG